MFHPTDLFDFRQTAHADLFAGCTHAWEALPRIKAYIASQLRPELRNTCLGRAFIGENVFIGEGTVVEDGVMIKGPAIIGRNCQIRHNAYLREDVLIGDNCVVGNAVELKNVCLFNDAQVPHLSYVGDSIFGYKAHLGAGVKVSNLKLTAGNVIISVGDQSWDTGLRKFGALLGDHAEAGCNSVLNPGTILGRRALVYPGVAWRGVLAADCIAKNRAAVEVVPRRT